MDLSEFDAKIINFPDDVPYDPDTNEYMESIKTTDVYKKFIELVNKIDELLELRHYEVLGESEFTKTGTESKYRGIVMNVSKNTDAGNHLSGKIMHTRRTRRKKDK